MTITVKKTRSFFARTGGKFFSKNKILPFIKDLEYNTYVEPFIGAGSVFLGRVKKVEVEVINDYDQLVINLWSGMKHSGDKLKSYKSYFSDKSVFKWWLIKEKQNRRMRRLNNVYKGNPKYLKEIYGNDIVENLKEDLFIVRNCRFGDTKQDLPAKSRVLKNKCSHLKNIDLDNKVEENKFYVRNKKYSNDETKWRLHNPNLCGWNNILNNSHNYKERLKDTLIYQGDYKRMIELYDSPDTLFYFDPPYTKNINGKRGDKCYSNFVELEDFYEAVKDIKGKVMISYNNDKDILERFKDYNIVEIKTQYQQKKTGTKKTVDILIMNF